MTERLDSGKSKSEVADKIGVYIKAFNDYMVLHNLKYTRPVYSRPKQKRFKDKIPTALEPQVSQVQQTIPDDPEDALKLFYRQLELKRAKRQLRELKKPYDW